MIRTSQALVFLAIATAASGALIAQRASTPPPAATPAGDWPTYNRDPGGTRFSPLDEITPANVSTLEVAWVYHMKPAAPAGSATPATPEATLPAGHETPPAPAPPAPGPASRRAGADPAGTDVDQFQPVARPPRLRLEREHAAGRRRRPLHVHAVRPRGRARSGIGQGEVGVPAALGQSVDARPGVLAR